MTTYESFIQAREKRAKKAKKMDFAKTKIINNKKFYQKSAGLRFLPV